MEKHEQNDLTLEDVLDEYTDAPETPAEPAETEAPAESDKPEAGETPAAPSETEKPKATAKPEKTKAPERKAEPVKEAAAPRSADAPAREPAVNQDVVEELEKHADDFGASPLARGYGSAFSAMGSSVPILEVREEEGGENEAGVRHDQRKDTAGL